MFSQWIHLCIGSWEGLLLGDWLVIWLLKRDSAVSAAGARLVAVAAQAYVGSHDLFIVCHGCCCGWGFARIDVKGQGRADTISSVDSEESEIDVRIGRKERSKNEQAKAKELVSLQNIPFTISRDLPSCDEEEDVDLLARHGLELEMTGGSER